MRTNSHELAEKLIETAGILKSKPQFEVPFAFLLASFSSDKENFIKAVRALLPGKKEMSDYSVSFIPKNGLLQLTVNRSEVCRKVQDVKWECEPLLSAEEEAQMQTEEAESIF